ncbi:hypothetical protein SAMN04489806_1208 [Paramicrobacterium humi]|uniref:Antitoxin ParD1/3/4 n=1 Tax=Paramicrobacterium humi TaxID=640635 RepID=A0A1H4KLU2_9MICO|nr:hypothetical protein SAMN04489806_1208 [Microbacterium humi]
MPDDMHKKLQLKAREHNQSLQQYLLGELHRASERTSITDVLNEIEARCDGRVGFEQAAKDLAEGRSQR